MRKQAPVPVSHKHHRRDPLKISVLMGRFIIALGYIGVFLQAVFGGFTFYIIVCDYMITSNYIFMSYFSRISIEINYLNIYVSMMSCIINTTYTAFCWILVPRRFIDIILTVCVVISIATLIISITNIKTSQIFYAQTSRQPDWYIDPNFDRTGEWKKKIFTPFKIKEFVLAIFYIIQALLFIFGHQLANHTLVKQFDI